MRPQLFMIEDTPEATVDELYRDPGDEVMMKAILESSFHAIVGANHPQTLQVHRYAVWTDKRPRYLLEFNE